MLRSGLIALTIAAGIAAGCGGDEEEKTTAAAAKAKPAAAKPDPDRIIRQPYSVTCNDIKDPQEALAFRGKMLQKLALDSKITNMQLIHVQTSIWYGMSEICKSKPATFEPAKQAVAGVKAGKYVTQQQGQ